MSEQYGVPAGPRGTPPSAPGPHPTGPHPTNPQAVPPYATGTPPPPAHAPALAGGAANPLRRWSDGDNWWPDLIVGLVVFFLVSWESTAVGSAYVVGLVLGLATGLSRRFPGAALGLVWLAALLHLVAGMPLLVTEVAVGIVAFAAARWGSKTVVAASAVSIALAVPFVWGHSVLMNQLGWVSSPPYWLLPDPTAFGGLTLGALAALLLLACWLAGLALRRSDRAQAERDRAQAQQAYAEWQRTQAEAQQAQAETDRAQADSRRARAETERQEAETERARAETERQQAEEIAGLRAEQTRLARDVHDVVGHSLTVIVAQAESAQFLDPADSGRHRQILADIAASARQSLGDVRRVLATTQEGTPDSAHLGSLDSLVDGVRASGNDVRSTVVGEPRPLPAELETVAFRVLQEMLTNALKHGRRGTPIQVERHWEGSLRMEVVNVTGSLDETLPLGAADELADAAPGLEGQGIEGMRRRLEAVGGHLDLRRRRPPDDGADGGGDPTYTVTAWIPLPQPGE